MSLKSLLLKHPSWLRVIIISYPIFIYFYLAPKIHSIALFAVSGVSIFWFLLFDLIYFSLASHYLDKAIYKELIKCYIRARPDRGTAGEEIEAWSSITEEMNDYVNKNEFQNISKCYSQNVSYKVSNLKALFEKSLKKFQKKESSEAWKKILRGVQRLRDQDVLLSLKSSGCEDVIGLLSSDEEEDEETPEVPLQ